MRFSNRFLFLNLNLTCPKSGAQEETFGPLAPIFKFEREEEALSIANNTTAGLASYFYTRDVGRVWRVGEALDFGAAGDARPVG